MLADSTVRDIPFLSEIGFSDVTLFRRTRHGFRLRERNGFIRNGFALALYGRFVDHPSGAGTLIELESNLPLFPRLFMSVWLSGALMGVLVSIGIAVGILPSGDDCCRQGEITPGTWAGVIFALVLPFVGFGFLKLGRRFSSPAIEDLTAFVQTTLNATDVEAEASFQEPTG
jgi:hypothetical protein